MVMYAPALNLVQGSKSRKDMTLSLKRLKRFLKYGLLDCPGDITEPARKNNLHQFCFNADADVIPADLQ